MLEHSFQKMCAKNATENTPELIKPKLPSYFWVTAGVQHIALYWHRSTRQLQCNVWQFNEAVGKINAKSIRQMFWVLQKKIGKRVSDRDNENINFDNFKEKIPTY